MLWLHFKYKFEFKLFDRNKNKYIHWSRYNTIFQIKFQFTASAFFYQSKIRF